MSRVETIIRNLPLVLLLVLAASMARADALGDISTALENGETAEAQTMLDALGEDATAPEAQLLQGRLWVQTKQPHQGINPSGQESDQPQTVQHRRDHRNH